MANKFTNKQYYQDIADAIRFINGLSRKYTPPQMAQAILDLDIGSGESPALQNIQVISPPNKTEYAVGTVFSSTGLIIRANYSNGYYKYVTSNVTLSIQNGYVFKQADILGITGLTVTYQNKTQTIPISVVPPLYGAEWSGSSTYAWTRTDMASNFADPVPAISNGTGSSPFDDIYPWAGMERVEDSDAGTLVKIPKYYYKWTRDGAKMKLQISPIQFSGSFVSPAHADRGDGKGERDYVYVGAYACDSTTYKSLTNTYPKVSLAASNFPTNVHNLGSEIWQWDYAMYWTIVMLYLVEYASWDSQSSIGFGHCISGTDTALEQSGFCDSMLYHTGASGAIQSGKISGHVRYRYIEDLWGNVQQLCGGIILKDGNVYCIKNPADAVSISPSSSLDDRFVNVGVYASSNGYPLTFTQPSVSGFEYALFPATTSSSSTHVPDHYYHYYASDYYLYIGGYTTGGNDSNGLFRYYTSNGAAFAYSGTRLMKLP